MAFDLRTHIRDPKSGRVTRTQAYRMHVSKDGVVYERDGVHYWPNGEVKEDKRVKAAENKAPQKRETISHVEVE